MGSVRRFGGLAGWALVAVLVAAIVVAGLTALRWIPLDADSGGNFASRGAVSGIAFWGVFLGGLGLIASGFSPGGRRFPVALFGPLAAALLAVEFTDFDPYDFPTLRRMLHGQEDAWVMIGAAGAAALIAALLTIVWPRLGRVATGVVMIATILILVGLGAH